MRYLGAETNTMAQFRKAVDETVVYIIFILGCAVS